MTEPGATPLFVDTGAFYARIDERDDEHTRAMAVFDALEAGELVYRPIYTSGFVLGELVALGIARGRVNDVGAALDRIRSSPRVEVLHPGEPAFAEACAELHHYSDQQLSLVDHLTGVLADERGVDHVFTFDPNDFETLGLTPIPKAIDLP
jgi:predicted nucleic acid-binding protein